MLRRPRWVFPEARPAAERALAGELGASRLLARLLANRGLDEPAAAAAFLAPALSALHDPGLFHGMDRASARAAQAVQRRERVTLYSDYDVDGVSGTSILFHLFAMLGIAVTTYIPERKREGYGLHAGAIDAIADAGCDLLITVDCGIKGADEVARAMARGIDVIVTDHHEPDAVIPGALAVINHKQPACGYPFKDLCGAGVAFKLAWAICQRLTGEPRVAPHLREFLVQALSLAALGTIADVVPLVLENRILAAWGLRTMERAPFSGLKSLLQASDVTGTVLAEHVAFRLGPRLNAAGRMGSARRALDLLTTADPREGARLAEELGAANHQRQQLERAIHREAETQILEGGFADRPVLVLAGEGWHVGVVGIVASRLVERHHRPAVMIALDGARGRGSVRSIKGYPILEPLLACSEHLVKCGGHAMAAGFEIQTEKVDAFRAALEEQVARTLDPALLAPTLAIDALAGFEELDDRLLDELAKLEPTGAGNPPALLATRDVEVTSPPLLLGSAGKHVSFYVKAGGRKFRVVGFGMAELAGTLAVGGRVDLAYRPTRNRFRGSSAIELHLADVAPAGA